MAIQSSQRLPETAILHEGVLQDSSAPILQGYPYTIHHTSYNLPENSPSRIQFYMQKTKSSSSTIATYRGQRDLHSRKENSMHRRQGDLLEIHPCVLQDLPKAFQAFQPQDLPRHSRHSSRSSHFRHSSHS